MNGINRPEFGQNNVSDVAGNLVNDDEFLSSLIGGVTDNCEPDPYRHPPLDEHDKTDSWLLRLPSSR